MRDEMPSDPKIALVSGANRGIGKAVAAGLWRAGWCVIGTRRAEGTQPGLMETQPRLYEACLDVRDQASIDRLLVSLDEKFGRLDVLVNNAGVGTFDTADKLERRQVQDMFDTNVVGLFALTQAACPLLLRAGGGRVVNVGSIVDNISVPGNAAYGASKAAVASMTGTLNEEYKDKNIRFSLVSLGAVRTEIWEGREGFDERQMLSVDEVADIMVDIAGKPLHMRIDAIRVNPPKGLL